MAKHTKTYVIDEEKTAREAVELLRKALAHLERILDAIDRDLDNGMEGIHVAVARESARISMAISALTGELRAREKAAAKAIQNLDRAKVSQWLRGLSEEIRDELIAEMIGANAEESVLA